VGAIFLSYRRDDAEGEDDRLFDDLTAEFGTDKVFMDVAGIEAGRDFRKVIDENVSSCSVLLSMIGKDWIDAKDEEGRRRLDNTLDFVRLETASALKRDIPVIPVLVQRGRMPRPEQLPDDIKDLAYRNAVELTHARWESDVQLLIKALRPHVGKDTKSAQDLASGKDGAPASEKLPIPGTTPVAPSQPAKTFRRGVVVAAVVTIALLACGLGMYEYKKAQQAAARKALAERTAAEKAAAEKAAADKEAARKAAAEKAAAEKAAADKEAARKAAAEKAAAEKTAAEKEAARKAAAEKAASEKAAAEKEAARKAAAEKAASEKAAAEKEAARKAAAEKAASEKETARKPQGKKIPSSPSAVVTSATCTALGSGRFSIALSGWAVAPPSETHFLYIELIVSKGKTKNGGIRWLPNCGSWRPAQPADGSLWDVSCVHRPNDSIQTNWETTRTVTTADGKPPPSGGIGTYKPGVGKGPYTELNLPCR
jgi:hypothetical protein